jgi:hypothetical protein
MDFVLLFLAAHYQSPVTKAAVKPSRVGVSRVGKLAASVTRGCQLLPNN